MLANLSSDEVFTPPELANEMLDLLPEELWSDPKVTFLDPFSKSGVFLREIAKRLNRGLESVIPDRQERLNHIFEKQLYGIAITELTGLLSRRSVYGSKKADGKYSFCETFTTEQGNIIFERIEHTWENGRCRYCGASKEVYEREDILETHAYQFIHTDNPEEIFNMKFDVIVGNPPYQLSDGGFGKSAKPIYHKFVQQAKKMKPRYLTMIIPARWYAGGKGLNDFRDEMLNDERIKKLIDFPDASECFPGVDIAGGVCYFLWDRDYSGPCEVTNIFKGEEQKSIRPLNQFDTFIRFSQAISIIKKVQSKNEPKMSEQVSSRKPFGLPTTVRPTNNGNIKLRWNKGTGLYEREKITVGTELIDKWKVISSYVSYDHAGQPDKDGKRKLFSKVEILPPETICTESYLVLGSYDNPEEAKNLALYLCSKFVRFLISQLSYTQHVTKDKFQFVPVLDMTKKWTDDKLYERYNLTKNEINFIESSIRPMEPTYE